ncbi:AMFR protein-like protein [Amniculicola lignicola CBS 123094]|uniref:Coupling of ubiquitin conjugation to ER degradation protein 1 n=1 Tax=Amniculicola lignicola CBS 123094 TaxID=1392246 RepID=A0A6A5WF89_9PLEO|nr:AMFR protein-like protein [Amniculicola lignicola CBS 123094]
MAEQTLNIPQLVVFIIVSVLAIRWYFSRPVATGTRPAAGQRTSRLNPAQIEQVAQMFPQLNRRDIAWDLQRNGGNVSATTEKVLSGRPLEPAPASFNPPLPRAAAQPVARPTAPAKASQPDLITRYNLANKLNAPSPEPSDAAGKAKTWSQDRNERQANLQRRREEMILAARRKLEEKEKAK